MATWDDSDLEDNCIQLPESICVNLNLNFGSYEPVHRWRCMPECDEFVGARRSKHTVVSYKDGIYVFGGDNGKVMLNDLLRFDVKEKSWGRALSSGSGTRPAPRYHHSAVVYKSSMLVFGGFTGDIQGNSNLKNQNDLFEYRFDTCQWIEWKYTGKAPVPRSAHGAAVYDDKLWIFAGYDGNSRLNDMWTIPLTGSNRCWEEVELKGDCPPTCCNFPVAVARDCMYVFSGQSGAKITNSLFYFHFKDKCWTRISSEHILRGAPPPPTRRYGHTMVAHDSNLYVFGGTADSTLPNDLHCFDLDTQTWSIIHPAPDSQIPSGRLFHASAVVGDAMYVFGGTVYNNVRSGDMYRFQIANYPKCTLHEDFGKILRSGLFTDTNFLVGENECVIKAHSAFVAARSEYLKQKVKVAIVIRNRYLQEKFSTTDVPPEDVPPLEIRLPDAVAQPFQLVLSYIYTDRIDPSPFKDNENPNKVVLIMMDVYRLAVLYMMQRLEQLSIQYLEATISLDNVLDLMSYACTLHLDFIKELCLRFVIRDCNYAEIVSCAAFEFLEKCLIVEIARRKLVPEKKCISTDCHIEITGTTLEQDMEQFLKHVGNEFCDISLELDGKGTKAHKAILAARSTYFEAMFRSFMPRDNIVKISVGQFEPSHQSLQTLLRYLYYGEVEMAPEDSLYLFSASHYFGLTNTRLKAFCKQNLQLNVQTENVLQLLKAADRISAIDMKKRALDHIVRNFSQVSRLPQLHELSRELLIEIMCTLGDEMADNRICHDMSSVNLNSD